MMRVIGITGGIGSGKSTVSGIIREMGYEVADADEIAREITEDSDVLREIGRLLDLTLFGAVVLTAVRWQMSSFLISIRESSWSR